MVTKNQRENAEKIINEYDEQTSQKIKAVEELLKHLNSFLGVKFNAVIYNDAPYIETVNTERLYVQINDGLNPEDTYLDWHCDDFDILELKKSAEGLLNDWAAGDDVSKECLDLSERILNAIAENKV